MDQVHIKLGGKHDVVGGERRKLEVMEWAVGLTKTHYILI